MAKTRKPISKDTGLKKDLLLRASTRLFAERGYGQTSVQQIVEAAQVSKGYLYHYFDSKDDLLYGIYEPLLAMQREHLDRIASTDLPVRERLTEAARDVVETSLESISAMKVFFQSIHLLEPKTSAIVRSNRREYHERFRSMVLEGQESGVFRNDVPADLVVHSFFGSVHHMCTWYHPDGALEPTEIAKSLTLLFIEGLDS